MNVGYITDIDNGRPPIITVNKNITTIDGYTPRNNKCYCYPYNFMVMYNNYGGSQTIKYEDFNTAQTSPNNPMEFTRYFVVGENPTINYIPVHYNGITYNYDYMVTFANFPVLPWHYDTFANWSALNSMSLISSYANQGINAITNIATGNAFGLLGNLESGLSSLASLLDKSRANDKTIGTVQGNFNIYSGSAGVYYKYVFAKAEYIHMIDDYFTHYGYQINETKTPSLHNRRNFDYIKTSDINIVGRIPQEDMNELKSLFNNGLTIWHNPATFGDYDVDNSPIT